MWKMNIKPLVESKELKVYRILKNRDVLTIMGASQLARIEKGFEGEILFEKRLETLSKDWLILNDLQFKWNNTEFQLDTVVIAQKLILLFDVKNYEGDYYVEDNQWYYINGTPIQNPVYQLERSELLLRRLLIEHGYKIPIKSYLVYVNPDFHLYNAPRNLPIIYPTQLNRFFDEINKTPSKINEYNKKLAHKLISLHTTKSRFAIMPEYNREELRKGIMCNGCNSFSIDSKRTIIVCKNCGCIEDKTTAILRSLEEYQLLFPERKIVTHDVYEWCNGIVSKKSIQRILLKNFTRKGTARAIHYVRKK